MPDPPRDVAGRAVPRPRHRSLVRQQGALRRRSPSCAFRVCGADRPVSLPCSPWSRTTASPALPPAAPRLAASPATQAAVPATALAGASSAPLRCSTPPTGHARPVPSPTAESAQTAWKSARAVRTASAWMATPAQPARQPTARRAMQPTARSACLATAWCWASASAA